MNEFIKKFPNQPSFVRGTGFKGYTLSDGKYGLELDYIDMMEGHEFYQKESESVHIYFIFRRQWKS